MFRRAIRTFANVSHKAPVSGLLVKPPPTAGRLVQAGDEICVMESMKMEIAVNASTSGKIMSVNSSLVTGDMISEGDVLFKINDSVKVATAPPPPLPLPQAQAQQKDSPISSKQHPIRPSLAALQQRVALLKDAARPKQVERRRQRNQLTARECVDLLCDSSTFREFGALAVPAQRRQKKLPDLQKDAPADGVVTGVGQINSVETVIVAVDATVMAGTQGFFHHQKIDRCVEIARRRRLPIVILPEGGGGRPNDYDVEGLMSAGLHINTWFSYAKLAGSVPRVAFVSGLCFAGSAAIAGCSDVVIATASASIGMGGPAMIEGGGLGILSPDQVGPTADLARAGAIDIVVVDDTEGCLVAKKYLSYFTNHQLETARSAGYQPSLRNVIPENRKRAYEIREIIETLFDADSILELRQPFGGAVTTSLARIGGRSVGVLASDSAQNGGAVDADAADKASRFLRLCNSFGLPIISLVDTPGFMVGVDAEKKGMMRKASRLFMAGASLEVPVFAVILRKAVVLGAMALCGGSTRVPMECLAWPDAEIGAMGVEGAIKLGFKKELEDAEERGGSEARKKMFENMFIAAYERNMVTNAASQLEVDDVIDPAQTRERLLLNLKGVPVENWREGRIRRGQEVLDSW